jgi:Mrp family chromosome partitioning ATPase
MLALFADTTLLFVRWARTPRKIVAAAYDKLARTGAKISGVVLTMVDVDQMARNNPTDGASYSKEVRRYYGRRAA